MVKICLKKISQKNEVYCSYVYDAQNRAPKTDFRCVLRCVGNHTPFLAKPECGLWDIVKNVETALFSTNFKVIIYWGMSKISERENQIEREDQTLPIMECQCVRLANLFYLPILFRLFYDF